MYLQMYPADVMSGELVHISILWHSAHRHQPDRGQFPPLGQSRVFPCPVSRTTPAERDLQPPAGTRSRAELLASVATEYVPPAACSS
ncbi:uncharacterized protein BDV17DRAFT_46088 [Aspergillus undulatus]|uniref:uncharacterized protein n=1 Tax=Aspergillus undulatus TaxID=1810928 RepID=UPI003CCCA665